MRPAVSHAPVWHNPEPAGVVDHPGLEPSGTSIAAPFTVVIRVVAARRS